MEATRRGFLTALAGFVAMPAVVKASSLMALRGERYDPTLILRDFCLSWWERLAEPTDVWMGQPIPRESGLWRQRVKRWSDFSVPGVLDVPMDPDCSEVAGVQFDNALNWADWHEKTQANPELAKQSLRGMDVRGWRIRPGLHARDGFGILERLEPVIELTKAEEAELIRERSNVDVLTGGTGFAFCDASLQSDGRRAMIIAPWQSDQLRVYAEEEKRCIDRAVQEERERLERVAFNRAAFFYRS